MPKAKSYDHEVLWPAIRILAEQGSINKLCELLQSGEDIYEVLTLHRFALRFLSFRPWANRNIDVLAAVGSAGIEVAMMAAEEKSDDSAWFREEASQLAYNTSLNLAACWDDGFSRTEAHFKTGLKLSQIALEMRKVLKKGPASMGLAWTAKGIHELALNKLDEALGSFETAKKLLVETAQKQGTSTNVSNKASLELILAHGYTALVGIRKGAAAADTSLAKVRETLESLKNGDSADRETSELGLEQIRMMSRHLGI